MLKTLIFTLTIFSTASVMAAVDDEPPIKAGAMIEVRGFDEASKTYDIVMIGYEAQGPNYAFVKSLTDAVTTLDAKKIARSPKSIVGNQYKLDKELKLESVLATEAKMKKKKK